MIPHNNNNMKILIIDNYDSFTYNLYQYFSILFTNNNIPITNIVVIKNNTYKDEDVLNLINNFNGIIISPGPGIPERKLDFGICKEVIKQAKNIPVLGILYYY
jgi:anthranilate/para-aminobenzoate synthase component II